MPTTYLSIVEFPGDGVTTQHEFNFAGGYISRTHVKAFVEDSTGARTVITVTDGMFVNDTTIDLGVAAPVGGYTRIYRETPRDAPLANFADGSRFSEADLDLVARQAVFAAAEAFDAGDYAGVNDLLEAAAVSAATASTAATSAGGSATSAAIASSAATTAASSASASAISAAASAAAASAAAATINPADYVSVAGAQTITGTKTFTGPLGTEQEGGVEVDLYARGYGVGPVLHGYYARGTKASPAAAQSGDLVFGLGARPWGSTWSAHSTSAIHMVATENHSGSAQGTDFRILVTPTGSLESARKVAVRYASGGAAAGVRVQYRMHGTFADRTKVQTDVPGENTSFTVVPAAGGTAANAQVLSADAADASRLRIEATSSEVSITSDAVGAGAVRGIPVRVGAVEAGKFRTDGTVEFAQGVRLGGATAPALKVKKLTGTTPAAISSTVSIPHGLTGANIRGIVVEVRPAGNTTQGFPPGVTFASPNKHYEVFFGAANIAISTPATNCADILSSAVTVLVYYE